MTRAKRAAKKVKDDPEVERPAVIAADHVRGRLLGLGAGAKKGWSRLTVYEREFRRGNFVCKERCADAAATGAEIARAAERYAAAKAFDEGWQVCTVSWPGSSGFEQVRGGGGTPGAFVDHQRDVKDYWRRVLHALVCRRWRWKTLIKFLIAGLSTRTIRHFSTNRIARLKGFPES